MKRSSKLVLVLIALVTVGVTCLLLWNNRQPENREQREALLKFRHLINEDIVSDVIVRNAPEPNSKGMPMPGLIREAFVSMLSQVVNASETQSGTLPAGFELTLTFASSKDIRTVVVSGTGGYISISHDHGPWMDRSNDALFDLCVLAYHVRFDEKGQNVVKVPEKDSIAAGAVLDAIRRLKVKENLIPAANREGIHSIVLQIEKEIGQETK
ncbi:MAG: hypothetical protein IT462_15240 [Planctomycetes bacterium]|nr:hypothetical protein [Planctomycetota bacterium]